MTRDAILGYAKDQHAFFIRLFENNRAVSQFFGLPCQYQDTEQAEKIMSLLYLKKAFWLSGSSLENILSGLEEIRAR